MRAIPSNFPCIPDQHGLPPNPRGKSRTNQDPTPQPSQCTVCFVLFSCCSHGWGSYGEGLCHSVPYNRNNARSAFLRRGSLTAFPPPPLTLTDSSQPDSSTFGTATLHAIRRTDLATSDAHLMRLRFCLAPEGKRLIFSRGGSQQRRKYSGDYHRVCRRNGIH